MNRLIKMYLYRLVKSRAVRICFALVIISTILFAVAITSYDLSITVDYVFGDSYAVTFIVGVCLAIAISSFTTSNRKNGFEKNIRSVYSFKKVLAAKCVAVGIMGIVFYAAYVLLCYLFVFIYNKGTLLFSGIITLTIETQLIKMLFLIALTFIFMMLIEIVPGTLLGTFLCLGVALSLTSLAAAAIDEAYFENHDELITKLVPSAHFYYLVEEKEWDVEYSIDYDKLYSEGKITKEAYAYLTIDNIVELSMLGDEELAEQYPDYAGVVIDENYSERFLGYYSKLPVHFPAKYVGKCLLLVMGYIVVTISAMYFVGRKKEVV